MKSVGIIGGIGPESTIAYYRLILQMFRQKLQTDRNPEIHIFSIDLKEMLQYVNQEQWKGLVRFMASKINCLPPVELVAMASNTPHIVFDELAKEVNVHMVSIVEETCKVVANSGAKKVALLGTRSTMGSGFYQRSASKYGIEVLVPDDQEQTYVHEKYLTELVFNNIIQQTKQGFLSIIEKMHKNHGIDGLILGGTELPLSLSQSDFSEIKVFDTTNIHVNALVDRMIQ